MDKWEIINALSLLGAAMKRDTVIRLLDFSGANNTQEVTDDQARAFWRTPECESWKRTVKAIDK